MKEAAAVTMAKRENGDAFDELINQAIDMGQKEFSAIEEVQNAVKSMVALSGDGEAPASVTRENYNALMKKSKHCQSIHWWKVLRLNFVKSILP